MPRSLLPLVALALVFAACSPDDPADPPSVPGADSTLVEAPPPDSGVGADTAGVPPTAGARSGSCDLREAELLCYAFTGLSWTPESAQTECSGAIGGTYSADACPTAGRIGECVYQPGGDAEREVTYSFYAPTEPFLAEARCDGVYRAF